MDVETRANRILKPMDRFRFLDSSSMEGDLGGLAEDEACIGIYDNDVGGGKEDVVVTNKGLLIRSKERNEKHVLFADIADVRSPSDKQDDYTVWLVLLNGVEVSLEIRGERGKFRDIFEFTRFLDRVEPVN